jgi:hypothetical protein
MTFIRPRNDLFFGKGFSPADVRAAGKPPARATAPGERAGASDPMVSGGAKLTAMRRADKHAAADHPAVSTDGESPRGKRQGAGKDCENEQIPPHQITSGMKFSATKSPAR